MLGLIEFVAAKMIRQQSGVTDTIQIQECRTWCSTRLSLCRQFDSIVVLGCAMVQAVKS
jgi:hypothetical protein